MVQNRNPTFRAALEASFAIKGDRHKEVIGNPRRESESVERSWVESSVFRIEGRGQGARVSPKKINEGRMNERFLSYGTKRGLQFSIHFPHTSLCRQVAGFAIGGLSGGEAKDDFWRMVHLSTSALPTDRPRYLMGVGFPVDLVVCVALGCDMFDCVYPTRTGRFGHALVPWGQLNLRQARYKSDFRPIDEDCSCPACTRPLSRAFIHASLSGHQVCASALISVHNLAYMLGLMRSVREAISAHKFPQFVRAGGDPDQSRIEYEDTRPPSWAVDALARVGIDISDLGYPDDRESTPSNRTEEEMKLKRSKVD
ncbi:unnamed protein product [Echinostoma caproni]|uniref:tRNA-guanine(15) transglycosylase-like domain-containing protein n=1 Tax=Echinostoma caproni TaxID=27848 RepID=A0A3P8ILY2_9TREM|nr:unnamed protein product [Echinostoma caproni]